MGHIFDCEKHNKDGHNFVETDNACAKCTHCGLELEFWHSPNPEGWTRHRHIRYPLNHRTKAGQVCGEETPIPSCEEIRREISIKIISLSESAEKKRQENLFRKAELFSRLIPDVSSKKK